MNRICFFFLLFLGINHLIAQVAPIKVDLEIENRPSALEYNEPGYTSWKIARVHCDSITVEGVKFILTATGPTPVSTFRSSWNKANVQAPNLMRLVGDGIRIDNDTLLKYPGKSAAMELKIVGLPVGQHTIQTYHNCYEDPTKVSLAPMNVYLDNILVNSNINRSILVLSKSDARILMTTLVITAPGQAVTMKFEADPNFVGTLTPDRNVILNAFEMNVTDATKLAHTPTPIDRDFHSVTDNGTDTLKWRTAIAGKVKSHSIYFGTDSTLVANATPLSVEYKTTVVYGTNEFRVDNLYSMNTYYWRVDETDSTNIVTKGNVWSFKPRQLAFKTAEGYGRFAQGGRGGKVVYVTNLNDAGPGSFREAVTANIGPRTVIFNVSGLISLQSRLVLKDNVYVAGQTAPGKGICFRTNPIGVASDCIFRFVRMRLGGGPTNDGVGIAGDNTIIDHASISWTIDEAFSSRNGKNVTLQKTLISEALNVAGHDKYPAGTAHGYAGTISGNIGSYHHNLLAHNQGRNFSMGNAIDGAAVYVSKLDLFNNVVYNFGSRANDGQVHFANFVNNYFKKGPGTTIDFTFKMDFENYGTGTLQAYYSGNILAKPDNSFICNGTDNTCGRLYTLQSGLTEPGYQIFVDKPLFPMEGTIHTAKDAYKIVLSDVGCNLPQLDVHDKRVIAETLNGSYTYTGSITGKKGIIDNEADAGGYEDYPLVTRASDFDTDLDGLPDWWEQLHGLNINSAAGDFSESNADADKDGFTMLDDYLEWMSVPNMYIALNQKDTIDLKQFCVGFGLNPQITTVSAPNMNVVYSGTNAMITPTTSTAGVNYFVYKVTDNQGTSHDKTLGVCIGSTGPTALQNVKPSKENCHMYPVIVSNELTILFESASYKQLTFELIDLTGKTIYSQTLNAVEGKNNFKLQNLEAINSQMMIARITDIKTGEIISSKSLVKK